MSLPDKKHHKLDWMYAVLSGSCVSQVFFKYVYIISCLKMYLPDKKQRKLNWMYAVLSGRCASQMLFKYVYIISYLKMCLPDKKQHKLDWMYAVSLSRCDSQVFFKYVYIIPRPKMSLSTKKQRRFLYAVLYFQFLPCIHLLILPYRAIEGVRLEVHQPHKLLCENRTRPPTLVQLRKLLFVI